MQENTLGIESSRQHGWRALSAMALVAVLGLGAWAEAQAAAFSIVPVRVYMRPNERATAVTLTNEGDEPVVLQAEFYNWSQSPTGEDQLTETEDLILSPSIVRLAPQAKQVVRLALLRPAPADRQATYRVILREVPEAIVQKGKPRAQIPITLALSVPIFSTPEGAAPIVSCRLVRSSKPKEPAQISCSNTGNAYAQIRVARLVNAAGQELGKFDGGLYVLPGATRSVALSGSSGSAVGAAKLLISYDDNRQDSFDLVQP